MIGIDGFMVENGFDWFCYYVILSCIFFVGFCKINGFDFIFFRGLLIFMFVDIFVIIEVFLTVM